MRAPARIAWGLAVVLAGGAALGQGRPDPSDMPERFLSPEAPRPEPPRKANDAKAAHDPILRRRLSEPEYAPTPRFAGARVARLREAEETGGTRVLYVWASPGWRWAVPRQEGRSEYLVLFGELRLVTAGETRVVSPGDLVSVAPGAAYELGCLPAEPCLLAARLSASEDVLAPGPPAGTLPVGRPGAGAGEPIVVVERERLVWEPGPPGLPPGVQEASGLGDPRTGPYVLYLTLPEGYRAPPHRHPDRLDLIVLYGAVQVDTDPSRPEPLGRGAFASVPALVAHSLVCVSRDGCTLALFGEGPFDVYYVDPRDDPRIRAPPPPAVP